MGIKNILYTEDTPDDLMIFKIALKRAAVPVTVHTVADGSDAIAWLRGEGAFSDRERHPLPDVLMLDLKMPRKNGFDVVTWLRRAAGFENLPVVILSSSDDPRDIKQAGELGVTRYFMKSATCEDVVDYLRSLM